MLQCCSQVFGKHLKVYSMSGHKKKYRFRPRQFAENSKIIPRIFGVATCSKTVVSNNHTQVFKNTYKLFVNLSVTSLKKLVCESWLRY